MTVLKWIVTIYLFIRIAQMWGKVLLTKERAVQIASQMLKDFEQWDPVKTWAFRFTGLFFAVFYFFIIWLIWQC